MPATTSVLSNHTNPAQLPSTAAARPDVTPQAPGHPGDDDPRAVALDLIVVNRPDALARVTGLLARHRCGLESLTFSPTDDPSRALIRICLPAGPAHEPAQIAQHFTRLLDVIGTPIVTRYPRCEGAGQES